MPQPNPSEPPAHQPSFEDPDDFLDHLIDIQAEVPAPVLIGFAPDDGSVSVAVTVPELDPRGAGASLFRFVAPDEWAAVGMSVVGLARNAHDRAPAGEARVDVLVDREGRLRSRLSVHEDDGHEREVPDPTARPGGIVVDALHRVLRIPAPGEPPPMVAMVVGFWLGGVLQEAKSRPRTTWADASHLVEPGPGGGTVRRGARDDVRGDIGDGARSDARVDPRGRRMRIPPSPESIAESIARVANDIGWAELRMLATLEDSSRFDLTADEAAWMDDVLFARWMVDSVPSPRSAIRALGHEADRSLVDGIRAVARCLELPDVWHTGNAA